MITFILGAAAVLVGVVFLVAQHGADRRRVRAVRVAVACDYAGVWNAQDTRVRGLLADRAERGPSW